MRTNKVVSPIENSKKKSTLNPEEIDHHGSITNTLGTGENAKDSIIYLVLKWSFISGTVITFLLVINNWLFRKDEKVPDLVNDIKITWSIIIPIITLALGYAFGKSRK